MGYEMIFRNPFLFASKFDKMNITRLQSNEKNNLAGLQLLLSQLCPNCPPLTLSHLNEILTNPNARLWIAKDEDLIIGSLTLIWYHIPTGTRACIEDVVVHQDYRGQKFGEKLVRHALDEAMKLGLTKIDLTSRPDRIAANNLYQKLGFKKRETNCYRLDIKDLK